MKKTTLPKTWQELKQQMEKSREEVSEDFRVTCICGNHVADVELTDEDYKELFKILHGTS